MRRLAVLVILPLLAVPAAARAATPESGSVSSASPKAEWTGTLVRPYLHHLVFNYEPTAGTTGQAPCDAPACDTFTLEVAESANLTIAVASGQTEDLSLRIQKPDGAWEYHPGWGDGSKATTVKYKNAATGTYVINVVARIFGTSNPTAVDDTADYTGSAVLAVAPPPAPEPAPQPQAPGPPPPAAQPKPASERKRSRAACRRKARKIKKASKRKRALKRCAKRKR